MRRRAAGMHSDILLYRAMHIAPHDGECSDKGRYRRGGCITHSEGRDSAVALCARGATRCCAAAGRRSRRSGACAPRSAARAAPRRARPPRALPVLRRCGKRFHSCWRRRRRRGSRRRRGGPRRPRRRSPSRPPRRSASARARRAPRLPPATLGCGRRRRAARAGAARGGAGGAAARAPARGSRGRRRRRALRAGAFRPDRRPRSRPWRAGLKSAAKLQVSAGRGTWYKKCHFRHVTVWRRCANARFFARPSEPTLWGVRRRGGGLWGPRRPDLTTRPQIGGGPE